MLSLGIMIYLVAKKIPQIVDVIDESQKGGEKVFSKIDKFIASLPLEKLDFIFSQMLEKMMRKFKLYVMKLDNQLSHHLKKFKKTGIESDSTKKNLLFEKLDSDSGEVSNSVVAKARTDKEEKFNIEVQNEAENKESK
jgi:hypothetical protein